MIEIPGYTVIKPIGKGGMGMVYLATQHSLSRQVAIKVLSDSVSQDDRVTERFLREARIAANLHHRHIGAVHDVAVHDGRAYIAMEYLPGGNVLPVAGEKPDAVAVLRIVRDVASALDYAHANGVVHRDIKPENILRRADGSCVLSDFGIARAIQSDDAITNEGAVIGTPHYMSPEQLRGRKIDGRADLYSLGVSLYQMLTGELPYQASNSLAIGMQHMSAPIPRLPAELARLQPLIDALLAKTPEERPQTGADVVRRIEALIAAGAATPRSPAQFERRKNPDRSKPVRPLTATIAVLLWLAVIGLIVAYNPWRQRGGNSALTAIAAPKASALPRLAMLPLDNLSPDPNDAFFADGLHDEVLTALSKLSGLQIISRTTMRIYRNSQKPIATVAAELHATHVMEGSVRRDGNKLRLSLQLTDARSDTQVWAETYDRTVSDALHLQSEVAQAVARELKARILPAEEAALAESASSDAVANEFFLKARLAADAAQQEQLLDQALQRDPHFIAALSERAHAHLVRYWNLEDLTPERLARARADLDVLQQIAPGSAQTNYALAYYDFYARLDYAGALARAEPLAETFPNRPELQFLLATLYRNLGRFEEATQRFERGLESDPLNVPNQIEWVRHLIGMRDYRSAQLGIDRLIALDPDNPLFHQFHAGVSFAQTASGAEFKQVLAKYGDRMAEQDRRDLAAWIADLDNDLPTLMHELETAQAPRPNVARPVLPDSFRRMLAAWLKDDNATARKLLPETVAYLELGPDRFPSRPLPKLLIATAHAYAGNRELAKRYADEALAAVPVERDAVDGVGFIGSAANVMALIGEPDRAMDLIERSLSLPFGEPAAGVLSSRQLRKALAGNPRYEALMLRLRAQFAAAPR